MYRVGSGHDVHRFAKGRRLVLGGIEIPYKMGLLGHSDADVLVHAICDALLGAAGMGDIGDHFPDTDPAYKGILSMKLLEITKDKVVEAGYELVNVDATVFAENPKLSPYKNAMEKNIASTLEIEEKRVNIKATTTEGLGFTGRGEGIMASCIVMIKNKEKK